VARFPVVNGGNYTVQATAAAPGCGSGAQDPRVSVYNEGGGAAIAANDDATPPGNCGASTDFTTSFTGQIRVFVHRFSTGFYSNCGYDATGPWSVSPGIFSVTLSIRQNNNLTMTNPANICQANTATFTGTPAGGSYTLVAGDGSVNASTGVYTPGTTGAKTVRYTLGTCFVDRAVGVSPNFTRGNITGGGGTICNGGDPGMMTASSSGGFTTPIFDWYYRDGTLHPNVGGWIYAGTGPTYDPPAGLTTTRSYAYYAYNHGCGAGQDGWSPNFITVTVHPAFSSGSITNITSTQCSGYDPPVLASSGVSGSGNYSYEWYFRDGADPSGGGGTLIGTGSTVDPAAITGPVTRHYRLFVRDNICGNTGWSSNSTIVTVRAPFVVGTTAGGGSTICNGGDPGAMTVSASGGSTLAYQWFQCDGVCDPAISGVSIVGATAATYDPPAGLTITRSYRCRVDDVGAPDCGAPTWSSTTVTVTVLGVFNAGNISGGGGTICFGGDPGAMTVAPSGGAGTYSYQWYYRDGASAPSGGGAVLIPGATAATYDPPIGLTTTRSYQVIVDATGTPDCGAATWSSNFITVNVLPALNGGAITVGGGTICNGGDPGVMAYTTAPSGGAGTFTYQWYYVDGVACPSGGGAILIPGATALSYDPPAGLTVTRTYQVLATATGSPACGTVWSSNCHTVNVLPAFSSGSISPASQSICNGGDPASFSVGSVAGSSSYSYQWYYKDGSGPCDASGWILISGATAATYDPPAGLATTRTYRCLVDATGSPDCGAPTYTSNCHVVTVVPNLSVGAISGGGGTICNSGDPGAMTVSASGGASISYQWYFRDGALDPSVSGTLIVGATAATYDPPGGLTTTRSYRCLVDATGSPDCGAPTWSTNFITVNVLPAFDPGNITGGSANICEGGDPLVMSVAPVGSGSYTYQWYQCDGGACDPTLGSPIGGATNATYDPPAGLTVTRRYRVLVTGTGSPACGTPTWSTNIITTTVSPAPVANAGAAINTCTGVAVISMAGATGTGTYSAATWTGGAGLGTWVQNVTPGLATFTPSVANGSFTATLTLTGSGACTGTNPTSTRVITWATTPTGGTLSSPTGSSFCNAGGIYTFNVTGVANASPTGYQWTIPAGGVIVGPSDGASIDIDFTSIATGPHIVSVLPRNTSQAPTLICPAAAPVNMAITVTTPPSSAVWSGVVNDNWNVAGNWFGGCAPGPATNAVVDEGNPNDPRVYGGNTGNCRDLTLNDAVTLTLDANSNLDVYRHFNANFTSAPFTQVIANPASNLRLRGGVAQNLNANFIASGNGVLGNLVLNGSAARTVNVNAGATGLSVSGLIVGTGGIANTLNLNSKPLNLTGNLAIAALSAITNPNAINLSGTGGTYTNAGTPLPTVTSLTMNMSTASTVYTLNAPVVVSGTVNLANGILRAEGTNVLDFTNLNYNANFTAAGSAYIWGGVRMRPNGGTGLFRFPVGSASAFMPMDVVWTAPTNHTTVTVEYVAGAPGSILTAGLSTLYETCMKWNTPPGYEDYFTHGQWSIVGAGGSSAGTYDLTLYPATGTFTPGVNCGYTIATRADLLSGTPWSLAGSCDPNSTTGGQITRRGMTSFSGKKPIKTLDNTPFPVELVDLVATANKSDIRLDWSTAVERNNKGFDIERSLNGTDFEAIGFVPSRTPNSNGAVYTYTDANVLVNTPYFYRLKQQDLNGAVSYSKVVTASIVDRNVLDVKAYPNPTSGNLTVIVGGEVGTKYTVKLYTATGQLVLTQELAIGMNESLDLAGLASGTYQLHVRAGNASYNQKLVKVN
jgi:hypothetical protein